MLAILLLLVGQGQSTDALMKGAENRLSVPCGAECAPPPAQARYRLGEVEPESVAPRTEDDAGTPCSAVGARPCTRSPRRLFSTPLPE